MSAATDYPEGALERTLGLDERGYMPSEGERAATVDEEEDGMNPIKEMIEALRSVDLPAEHVFGDGWLDLHNAFARDAEFVAAQWLAEGLTPKDAAAYLSAGCWDARAAGMLARWGITPEQAAQETDQGHGGDARSIGAKVANGDLTIHQAQAILAA